MGTLTQWAVSRDWCLLYAILAILAIVAIEAILAILAIPAPPRDRGANFNSIMNLTMLNWDTHGPGPAIIQTIKAFYSTKNCINFDIKK